MIAVSDSIRMSGALALGACLAFAAVAQPHAYVDVGPRAERIEGLSHNSVLSLLQDHLGFLWIGTSDGLNRFDAATFVVYRHVSGDATSLAHNTVKALAEDRAGDLWVGTDRGLDRFDRRTGRFEHIPLGLEASQRSVLDVLADRAGSIWAATNAGGLYRVDPASRRVHAYRHVPGRSDGLADDNVWSLYEDREGTLWVATTSALHAYDPVADRMRRAVPFDGWTLPQIVHEDGAYLWLADDRKMRAFDRTSGNMMPSAVFPTDRGVRAVAVGLEGARWVGTPAGLFRMDPVTGGVGRFDLDPAPSAFLPNNIKTLYRDRAGALWVGTLGGLFRVDPFAKPFRHFARDPTLPGSLGDNTVMAVRESRDGVLWLGTLGGGLLRLDRQKQTIDQYRHQPGREASLCSDLVWSLAEDGQGWVWVGTDAGLCVLDPRTRRFTMQRLPGEGEGRPVVNAILPGTGGKEDKIWVGTYLGLYEVDRGTGRASLVFTNPHITNPAFGSVQALYRDRRGDLWVGFFGGAVYRYQPLTGASERVHLQVEDGQELVGEGIWAIHEDGEGRFWFGGDVGLIRLDPVTEGLYYYDMRDGLPGSIVYTIVEDAQQRLWISTNHGLVRLDPRRPPGRQMRVYQRGDGLKNTEFNRRAAWACPHDELFFGGLHGLTSFFPEHVRDNLHVPPIVLTRIRTAGRDTVASIEPFGLDRLVLTHREARVAFEFAALNFSNPLQNRYAYRLEGFDEQWMEADTRRMAEYTNLPAGAYVFHVRGANDDGLWNEAGAALAVQVLPPFWQTWWFRLLVAAVAMGLLALLYRLRVRHLIEMERLRLRIAGDLHDDIGSNLSSIALLSDMVHARAHLGERERAQLTKISRSARAMVGVLRDIVWSVDPEADTTEELLRRMEETASSMLDGLRWRIHRPEKVPVWELDMATRRHVFLIYKETLHNVVRHARATEVRIEMRVDEEALRLSVTDDGVGFDPATVRRGRGLESLGRRTREIGGELSVTSAPGAGTRIVLRMSPRIRHRHFVSKWAAKRRERAVRETA